MYELVDIKRTFIVGNEEIKALDGINLTINDGKFVAFLGESGSGKSTLLRILGGLDSPTSGKLLFNGKDLSNLNDDELSNYRSSSVGFVFQNYNLVPTLTVYENIVMPILIKGEKENREKILGVMRKLGIDEKKNMFPGELSGGQQQRAAIARAFATHPDVILADEPTGNLDSKTSDTVVKILHKMQKEDKQTIIVITHNEEIAKDADMVVRIKDGHVISVKEN